MLDMHHLDLRPEGTVGEGIVAPAPPAKTEAQSALRRSEQLLQAAPLVRRRRP
jgi:hypothetical protein